jgi:hypothetical protein
MFAIPSIYLWSAGAALLAFIGMLIGHRLVKPIDLKENQAALDATLNIVGTLVSILLGLLVAASLNNYQTLESAIDSEATSVAEVCRLSIGLPPQERNALLLNCLEYCDYVVKEEWPAMTDLHTSETITDSYAKLLKRVVTFNPKTAGETNIQAAMITAIQDWGNYRRQRFLWLNKGWDKNLMPVLFMCSFIVLIFANLYVTRQSIVLHSFLICFVATALGANLGLIYMLGHPFSGDWLIEPKGFKVNAQLIRKYTEPIKEFDLNTLH